jgi:hypothetical protein
MGTARKTFVCRIESAAARSTASDRNNRRSGTAHAATSTIAEPTSTESMSVVSHAEPLST